MRRPEGWYDGRPGGDPGTAFNDQTREAVVGAGPSRARTMPPHEVDQHRALETSQEAELVHRLELALAQLPEAERTAVVAAIGFAGGSVGAAMELGLEIEDADALTRNGLQLLRAALADLDPHGRPLR